MVKTKEDYPNFDWSHVKLYLADGEAFAEALHERRIKHQDVSLLMFLALHVDPRTGRIRVSLKYIAEKMGLSHTAACTSFKRLQENGYAVRCRIVKTGDTYILLNPYLFSPGTEKVKGWLWKQFKEAQATGEGVDLQPFDPSPRVEIVPQPLHKPRK